LNRPMAKPCVNEHKTTTTSEAYIIPEEITSKAELVEKRVSDNRENDTILHNFRQKQPGD